MDSFMIVLKSIILGIVEGITEFLPISSTGHMIIVENLINFKGVNDSYVEMYTYVIQLGAILAVVVLYWGKIKETLINFFPGKIEYKQSGFYFWFMLFIACIPGGILGILFDDMAEKYLFSPIPVAITLFLGGILMIYMENIFRDNNKINNTNVTPIQAFIIGICQCLAIVPGMSRSASTIIGGWMSGLSTVAAAEFSFFLAIPVMVGMSFFKIFKIGGLSVLTTIELISLVVGFMVSFIVALIVIKKFIDYLKKKSMKIFAIYRILFSAVIIITGFLGLFK